ncbi:MAG: hypothetical protein K2R93_06650 [Gemmatimonadaceae bacterium]|nr:hypothetical protein [Gemmatimonadaceae bacterium]
MHVVAVDAPIGQMEPAPITSLSLHMDWQHDHLSAFFADDDSYYVRAEGAAGVRWFRVDAEPTMSASTESVMTDAERLALGALLADIIPLGGHRVAFPVGSTGRRVYRVWRGAKGAAGKTRILGVRAARSRRLPA